MSVTRCGMKTSSPSTTCGIPPGQPGRHPADPGGAGDPPTWTGSQGRAVVHCAAYIDVAQPAREPGMYWRNNVAAPAAFFEKARGKDVVSRRRPPSTGSRSRCRSPTPRRARAQAEDFAQGHEPDPAPTSAQWRRLIAKIWEADALTCPDCGGRDEDSGLHRGRSRHRKNSQASGPTPRRLARSAAPGIWFSGPGREVSA